MDLTNLDKNWNFSIKIQDSYQLEEKSNYSIIIQFNVNPTLLDYMFEGFTSLKQVNLF